MDEDDEECEEFGMGLKEEVMPYPLNPAMES